MPSTETLYIVDDDPATCRLVESLAEHLPCECASFPSVELFLDALPTVPSGCIVLDVRLPGRSGIELQGELAERGYALPIVFLSGFADIQMVVESMQLGAADFIEKPFRPQHLLKSIQAAMRDGRALKAKLTRYQESKEKWALLTEREAQVVKLVADGVNNKAIAAQLGVTPQAIDARRLNAMGKLRISSVAEAVRLLLVLEAGVPRD